MALLACVAALPLALGPAPVDVIGQSQGLGADRVRRLAATGLPPLDQLAEERRADAKSAVGDDPGAMGPTRWTSRRGVWISAVPAA